MLLLWPQIACVPRRQMQPSVCTLTCSTWVFYLGVHFEFLSQVLLASTSAIHAEAIDASNKQHEFDIKPTFYYRTFLKSFLFHFSLSSLILSIVRVIERVLPSQLFDTAQHPGNMDSYIPSSYNMQYAYIS